MDPIYFKIIEEMDYYVGLSNSYNDMVAQIIVRENAKWNLTFLWNFALFEVLSKQVRVGVPYLCEMEKDKANPSLKVIRKICDYYGLTLSELFMGVK